MRAADPVRVVRGQSREHHDSGATAAMSHRHEHHRMQVMLCTLLLFGGCCHTSEPEQLQCVYHITLGQEPKDITVSKSDTNCKVVKVTPK